ncbi:DUF2935 domain-containing protein [Clostridium sp. 'White wine YQ']|uniref:DUF2935 domain-containing protein n=1 Tax=Clostridium sp. 'White wine YQ' TaxID=3027474 RepID=UPI00236571D8|nr:DUF2935 domain-containing protein [Clostridium sp. 'White wine YQ']MDD7794207.1 DUF2935 domain-containing protein [Clostridium sp. 'White wine YQ']
MISSSKFINQSLELHLFFGRIMKEHALFLQLSFTPKDVEYMKHADMFRRRFDKLFSEVLRMSSGVIRPEVMKSGELVTPFTLKAEMATQYFTGVDIATELTQIELGQRADILKSANYNQSSGMLNQNMMQHSMMQPDMTMQQGEMGEQNTEMQPGMEMQQNKMMQPGMEMGQNQDINMGGAAQERRVFILNQTALDLLEEFAGFKADVLGNIKACKMVTTNIYPTMLQHLIHEAQNYYKMIQKLQSRQDVDLEQEAYEEESTWNHLMEEHAKFIRGLLDPSEDDLIKKANEFADEFEELTKAAKDAMDNVMPLDDVTNESIEATTELRDFKAQGTQGILECKIKSLILPLLSDHVLREANHYLRLLDKYKQ